MPFREEDVTLPPVTAGAVNKQDVVVVEAHLDFDRWNWEYPDSIDEICEHAAEIVMRQLTLDAAIEFSVKDGHAQLQFGAFEYEFRLQHSLLGAVDYWLETRTYKDGGVGPVDQPEYQETAVILADLEEACRRLRAALDKSKSDA